VLLEIAKAHRIIGGHRAIAGRLWANVKITGGYWTIISQYCEISGLECTIIRLNSRCYARLWLNGRLCRHIARLWDDIWPVCTQLWQIGRLLDDIVKNTGLIGRHIAKAHR
jgi:hypothetical protein